MLKNTIKQSIRRLGYVATRYDKRRDPEAMRHSLLDAAGVTMVLDVGANTGQYAARLRGLGYRGHIASFEPLSGAFRELKARASGDDKWSVYNCAVGASDGRCTIHVAGNSASSSLLEMLPRHLQAAPHSAYIGREEVALRSLDSLLPELPSSGGATFLKIDAQGYTSQVLAGANRSLEKIVGLEVELSTVSLYEGEPLIHEVLANLHQAGFALHFLEPELLDEDSGQQLQLNGLFFRPARARSSRSAAA